MSVEPKRQTLKDGRLHIKAWCACGSSVDSSSLPHKLAEDVYHHWRVAHNAPGHYLTTPEVARRARRRQEAA